jgi:hypothetical protein
VSLAGTYKYAKSSLLKFTESTLTHDVLLYPVKDSVWCAVSARRIVGPVLFNETIKCERYVHVILRKFFPELPEEERLYGWFPQESATATLHVCLRGQNYQQWYLAITFTRSQSLRFFSFWVV